MSLHVTTQKPRLLSNSIFSKPGRFGALSGSEHSEAGIERSILAYISAVGSMGFAASRDGRMRLASDSF